MKNTSHDYPLRVQAFRTQLIRMVPKVPNTRDAVASMHAMPTRRIILAYMNWQMRKIPAKPRVVGLWSGGLTEAELWAAAPKLRRLLIAVENGDDLTSFLSDLVTKAGFIVQRPGQIDPRDKDHVLTRVGLHHFHFGKATADNPKGRSGGLLFVDVTPDQFRIVALADHKVFVKGSAEQARFYSLSTGYVARNIPAGQGFMLNPVMANGDSMLVLGFSDRAEAVIEDLEPRLDDPAYADELYAGQVIKPGKQPHPRPACPIFEWHFEDLQFGVLERRTRVFFSLLPFFAR